MFPKEIEVINTWNVKPGRGQPSSANQSSLVWTVLDVLMTSICDGNAVKAHQTSPEPKLFPRSSDALNLFRKFAIPQSLMVMSNDNNCSKKGCRNIICTQMKFRNEQRKILTRIYPCQILTPAFKEGFQMAVWPTAVSVKLTLQKATVFEIASEKH